MQEKDIEIAGLKDERDCGFVKVDELERALRPFKDLKFEQTWGGTAMENEQESGNGLDVNNEELFNQVINE